MSEREYYILAGRKGLKQVLEDCELETTPVNLLIVKENSKLGKQIKKEAKRKQK